MTIISGLTTELQSFSKMGAPQEPWNIWIKWPTTRGNVSQTNKTSMYEYCLVKVMIHWDGHKTKLTGGQVDKIDKLALTVW